MNGNKSTNSLSVKKSKELSHRDASVSTENNEKQDDAQTTTWPTYDSFSWFYNYTKMFTQRLIKDLLVTLIGHVYSGQIVPPHIADLISVQKNFVTERESQSITYRREDMQISVRTMYNAIKTYILSSEDDVGIQCASRDIEMRDREPMFVIVDSSCVSDPSSREMLIEKISETSLDVHIPSFPGSPRSINLGSDESLPSNAPEDYRPPNLRAAVAFLHEENEFLGAAECGDVEYLRHLISSENTNIQQRDLLGRNALHLAICSGNHRAIRLLLQAGVNPNVKDSVGMTPLSLYLWRSPTLEIVKLLFDHGAMIMPRSNLTDTGLFYQYVMICTPTKEEEQILRLLVEKGALINDPEAPGGRQALHLAAMSNNCDMIEILINLGANLFLTNTRNQTPKEFAHVFKCREAYTMLEQLEELNADNMSYLSRISDSSSVTTATGGS